MREIYLLTIIMALIASCQFDTKQQVKESDSDQDGVYDNYDECPNTYGLEEFNGCPDTDEDGIPDHEDECPDEFGIEELDGCPKNETKAIETRLTAADCYKVLSLTKGEIKEASSLLNVGLNDLITFESCEIISDYIFKYREIKRDQANLQKQIDGGYIQTVLTVRDKDQYIIVLKGGIYYLMEIVAGGECTMGTMEFNENTSALQDVFVRESPSVGKFKGFRIRIIDKNNSLSTLQNKLIGL